MRPDISFLARYVLGHGNTTARCRADVISFDRQVLAAVRDSISALVAPACARAGLPRPSPGADAGPAAPPGAALIRSLKVYSAKNDLRIEGLARHRAVALPSSRTSSQETYI